jgi:hypothetical protein
MKLLEQINFSRFFGFMQAGHFHAAIFSVFNMFCHSSTVSLFVGICVSLKFDDAACPKQTRSVVKAYVIERKYAIL